MYTVLAYLNEKVFIKSKINSDVKNFKIVFRNWKDFGKDFVLYERTGRHQRVRKRYFRYKIKIVVLIHFRVKLNLIREMKKNVINTTGIQAKINMKNKKPHLWFFFILPIQASKRCSGQRQYLSCDWNIFCVRSWS